MPSGQFNTVVISVSDILPLDKGHYISVSTLNYNSAFKFHDQLAEEAGGADGVPGSFILGELHQLAVPTGDEGALSALVEDAVILPILQMHQGFCLELVHIQLGAIAADPDLVVGLGVSSTLPSTSRM